MITFNNGTKLETVSINGGTMQFQSANRSTLEIKCSTKVATFDKLKALYTDANALSVLTISKMQSCQRADEEGNPIYIDAATGEDTLVAEGNEPAMVDVEVMQSVHVNFTIPVELKLTTVNDEEVYCMTLAQLSALEITQAKQANDIATNEAALIELAEIIAGGTE